MYYTHLYGKIRKSIILLYMVFNITFIPYAYEYRNPIPPLYIYILQFIIVKTICLCSGYRVKVHSARY